jgi:predicted DNA-binding WGR domain protein
MPSAFRIVQKTEYRLVNPAINANKFWSIWGWGSYNFVHFGRIGTKGQKRYKLFNSEADASAEFNTIRSEKIGKGYKPYSNSTISQMVERCVCGGALFAEHYNANCPQCGSITKIDIGSSELNEKLHVLDKSDVLKTLDGWKQTYGAQKKPSIVIATDYPMTTSHPQQKQPAPVIAAPESVRPKRKFMLD